MKLILLLQTYWSLDDVYSLFDSINDLLNGGLGFARSRKKRAVGLELGKHLSNCINANGPITDFLDVIWMLYDTKDMRIYRVDRARTARWCDIEYGELQDMRRGLLGDGFANERADNNGRLSMDGLNNCEQLTLLPLHRPITTLQK